MVSPLIILASFSVGVGLLGSLFILLAISVDSWEEIEFNLSSVNTSSVVINASSSRDSYTKYETNVTGVWTSYYLYYQYGGAWRLCDLLSDSARSQMALEGVSRKNCYNFVSEYDEESTTLSLDGRSIARLQNSGASCFIVCIIDLVAAVGVGILGLTQKQVAACMVTGVLYCMASLFTIFGLAIYHVKHYYEIYDCQALYPIPQSSCGARTVTILWAVPVAWVGVIICAVASVLWLFLTRALRVIKAKTMI